MYVPHIKKELPKRGRKHFSISNINRFEKKIPSSSNKFPLVREHPNAMSDLRVGGEIKTILDISCFHCCRMIGKKSLDIGIIFRSMPWHTEVESS